MAGLVMAAVAAGCTGGGARAVPDAPLPPVVVTIHVVPSEQPRAVQPSVVIDGVTTLTLETQYTDSQEAVSAEHHVELRYEDQAVFQLPVRVGASCGDTQGRLVSASFTLSEYDSGDLRFYSDAIQLDDSGCLGDAFAIANCFCTTTERCVPRIALADPLFTHLGCVPIGPKQRGDACTLVPDPDGAYDDCGAGLFCYQGTCHGLCGNPPLPQGLTDMPLPDGYPRDAFLCD